MENELPVFLFVWLAIGMAVATLILAHWIAPRRDNPVKLMPYESGMDPVRDARQRFDVRFYLIAISFLIFDVELVFLYPWAVAAGSARVQQQTVRNELAPVSSEQAITEEPLSPTSAAVTTDEPGTMIYAAWQQNHRFILGGVLLFLALLGAGYVYEWRKGVYQWR